MTDLPLDWDAATITVPEDIDADGITVSIPVQQEKNKHIEPTPRMCRFLAASIASRWGDSGGFVRANVFGDYNARVELTFDSLEGLQNWDPEDTRATLDAIISTAYDRYSAERSRERGIAAAWLARACDDTVADMGRVRAG